MQTEMRDTESSFQEEPVQECKGHLEVRSESDLFSQPEEYEKVKSEVEDFENHYILKQGMAKYNAYKVWGFL